MLALWLAVAGPAMAAVGDLLGQFNFGVSDMVADPSRSLIYATVPSTNSVAVFNSATLSLVTTVPIGANPSGLSLSPDNSKLYVANRGSLTGAIGVLNLNTLTALPSLNSTETVFDVAVGNGGRLYASTPEGVMQFDLSTGTHVSTFPGFPDERSYGVLETSRDRNTLYLSDASTSPNTLQRFDISTGTASLLQQRQFMAGGGGGVAVSNSGEYVATTHNYTFVKLAANNINTTLGAFNTDAYPTGAVFSNDDSLLFAGRYGAKTVTVFNANTTAAITSFGLVDDPTSMVIDRTGQYLFVGEETKVEVFSTGVPEPGAWMLVGGALGAWGLGGRFRRVG